MIKRIKDNPIVQIIAAVLLYLAIEWLIDTLISKTGFSFGTENSGYLIRELVHKGIPAVLVAALFKTLNIFKSPLKGLGRSLLCNIWMFIINILGICSYCSELTSEGPGFKPAVQIFFYVLFVLAIGFSEELICRGTVTELLLRRFGRSEKGTIASILIGALIFGLFHFTNILNGQSLRETVLQVISTFLMGCFLNTIYARYRNIYAVMFIHGMIDLMSLQEYGLTKGLSLADTYSSGSTTKLPVYLICSGAYVAAILIVYFVTRKKGEKKNVQKDT